MRTARAGAVAPLCSVGGGPAALPALWPLLRPGFFVSDDGLFHVYRIAALADAWAHGVLYPRLFPEFGFGYGQAVFNFYAPLSYVPGALLALLGHGRRERSQIVIALATVLAALAAYGFVNHLWGPTAGVLAAVAYTYFPYHLADAYQRGADPRVFRVRLAAADPVGVYGCLPRRAPAAGTAVGRALLGRPCADPQPDRSHDGAGGSAPSRS